MKNEKFDRLLSAIRNEQVDDKAVDQAAGRVWNSIAGTPVADVGTHKLRNCEDFQALIPQYLGKQLAGARALLLEDHVHACVACRHAVERARNGEQQAVWRPEIKRRSFPVWRWAMAAAAVAAVAFVALALSMGVFPGQQTVRGIVQNADGSLYAVTGDNVRIVPAGYEIRSGDEIRTAKGASAVVRLVDGSLVEMGERADISLSREWKGTTIHLDGGQVIVQAAKQHARSALCGGRRLPGLGEGDDFLGQSRHQRLACGRGRGRGASGLRRADERAACRGRSDLERQCLDKSHPGRNRLEQERREIPCFAG